MAYTAFGTLGVIVLSVIIGAVVYGLQAGNSGPALAAHREFQVSLDPAFCFLLQHMGIMGGLQLGMLGAELTSAV